MSRADTIRGAMQLIDIYNEAGRADENRGQVVARLAGTDTTSDAFITALTYIVEQESRGVIYLPGAFEACLNAFSFGVALAAHKSNQESAHGSEGEKGRVSEGS